MNIWVPQSEQSKAEHLEILSVEANFTSGQHSRPIIAMKQDAMTGGYVLTYGDVSIPKHTFFDCLCIEYLDIDVMEKYEHIKKVYEWKGIDKEAKLFVENKIKTLEQKLEDIKQRNKTYVNNFKNASSKEEKDRFRRLHTCTKEKFEETKKEIQHIKENFDEMVEEKLMYNGRTLFSFLLPNDFEYTYKNDMSPDGKPVFITRGVMISGTLNKAVMGSSTGSISHMLFLRYSAKRACEFVSIYQMFINRWLLERGLSVGIEDCVPKETDRIKAESSKCFSNALLNIQTEEDEELLEIKINSSLNNARDLSQRLAKEALSPYNSFVSIIRSGAKGNDNNITQITSMLGQQNMEGMRMRLTFGGRALPHFKKDWEDYAKVSEISSKEVERMFQARGFVSSSFYKGLDPHEFFFHAVGGREGCIDTAVKSVCYDTEILIQENGKTIIVKIGEWIDLLLENDKESVKKDNSENEDRELLDLQKEVYIPTSDLSGNVSWGKVTAITSHNPTNKMYEIKTLGGRKVTVTDSHSLLVWNKNKGEFERIKPEYVKAGDYVPTTERLCEPKVVYDYFDTSILFPKTEFLYGSDFLKAKKMLEEKDKNITAKSWYEENNNKTFTLPYSNIQKFVRPLSRSNIDHIQENCIYPFSAQRTNAIIKDKFEFSYENGVFLGLYIAEGNLTDGYIAITNKDPVIIEFISNWFDKHNIKHKTNTKINNIGGNSTTTRGYSSLLSKIVHTLCGKGAKNKYIHPSCLAAQEEFIKGLLSGMFSGDGHITKNSVEISTASRRLSDDICVCLSRLGIFGKQFISKVTSTNLGTVDPADSHRISIRANWALVFKNKINLVSNIKQILLNEMKPSDEHRNFATKNDVVLDKIVSIEVVDYKHKKVYDLTVPSTLNFGLANGLHVVDTASTGYMQRKLIKLMEDLKVNYAGIVEGSNNSIVAFDYGGDNYDGSKIIYKGGQPNFIDVESLCDKLNTDYEWEQYTKNLKTNIEIIVEDDIKEEKNDVEIMEEENLPFEVSDVCLFDAPSKRTDNDKSNKTREIILEHLSTLSDKYLKDITYGNKWTELKQKWVKLFDNDFVIERVGGRKNYDFLIKQGDEKKKVEFKFNATCIENLPQFLSLSANHIMDNSYAEYFYDNYLSKMVEVMKIENKIPEKEFYLKKIHSDNYDCDPFFREMKEKTNSDSNEIVNESIYNFLKKYGKKIDLEKLKDKIDNSLDKEYVMWNCKTRKFMIQTLKRQGELRIRGLKNKNTIVVSSSNLSFYLLLRWRNHKGVMFPAWQIGLEQYEKKTEGDARRDEKEEEKECDDKMKIVDMFKKNVKGKSYDKKGNHDGEEGHWLEEQMGIKHNSNNEPDLLGYEMKKFSAKISFGDFSASEYLFSEKKSYLNSVNKFSSVLSRDEYIKIFGTFNKNKERYSWSGSCIPKYGEYNSYGQKLQFVGDNLCVFYSYSHDDRKVDIQDFLKKDDIVIAYWSKDKLKKCVENKFNNKGFFICKKEDGKYSKICFGKPFTYDFFCENIRTNEIFFDSGMYQGNNRNYSQFRSNFSFWNKLIYEEY